MAERAEMWHEISVNVGWGILRGKTCVVGGTPFDALTGFEIVGLHGWLDNCNSLDTLVPLLPQNTKVLVLDLPGHGLSDHLPLGAHYNPFVYAVNIRNAVLELGWKKFVLLGHSFGGTLSAMFAALFPEHVQALISLDFVAPFDTSDIVEKLQTDLFYLLKCEQHVSQPPLVFSEKEAINRLVSARFLGYSDGEAADREAALILLPRSIRQVDEGYAWSHDLKVRALFPMCVFDRVWIELISAIKCPVLLIQASKGTRIFPKETFEATFNTYRKHAQWLEIKIVEGSHHIHLTKPEQVAPIVIHFLEKVSKEINLPTQSKF